MEDEESEREDTTTNNNNNNNNHELILRVLELLKQASQELHSHPSSSSSSIHALLHLHSDPDSLLSSDPNLSRLSLLLSSLKSLSDSPPPSSSPFFLRRRSSSHQLSRVAAHIESELQSWIDRESLHNLVSSPSDSPSLPALLSQFHTRLSQGFTRDLQDLILKSKVFNKLESILCDPDSPLPLRERAAELIEALIHFNKNVFVGQVLMGRTVRALIDVNSFLGLRVLCSLIRWIKSPFVDEIDSNDELPKIIALLESEDVRIRGLALDCVLEIAYFGRKESIDSMMEGGIVNRLMELQRSDLGGDLIDVGRCEEEREMAAAAAATQVEEEELVVEEEKGLGVGVVIGVGGRRDNRERYLEKHPFASCVARFAVQLEVGEGLRQREKRALKLEVLKRVREASVSDAEAATIGAEVLWGSSL